jgi:hypothetical protein
MSKRKPLPYAAGYLLDQALMAIAEARRQLKPLLEKSDIETVARTGRALDEINQAGNHLHEIKNSQGE